MNIHIQSTHSYQSIVFPFWQNDDLESSISELKEKLNFNVEIDFEAKSGEVLCLYMPLENSGALPNKVSPSEVSPNQKVFLCGLGNKQKFSAVVKSFQKLIHFQKAKLGKEFSINPQFLGLDALPFNGLEAIANGLLLGTYDVSLYQTKEKKPFPVEQTGILADDVEENVKAVHRGVATAEVQIRVKDLVNAPANKLYPEILGKWTKDSGEKYGYEVKVLEKEELEEKGFHALLNVGKASINPPVLIEAEYKPEGIENLPKVGLVGKGITYDTGGLSIKTSEGMVAMKCDMGGSSIVLGALELVAKLKLPIHLKVIVPAAENDVDARSVKPGDVIGSYSGKTIEVIDTDAEGRLVLADGVAYMNQTFQPDFMIDAATLTGSSIMTLGYEAGALFSNDDELANQLIQSGERVGERLWRLPIWEEYADEMKSDIADIKNFHGKRYAGAITAAKFVEFFIEDHPKWAHLDIAGMVFGSSEFSSMRSATGYGVRLLLDFLEGLIDG